MKRALASENGIAKIAKTGHWSTGLLSSMDDPEFKVQEDDLVVVIKDKYPKATFHYLVMPKENINTLKDLGKEHVKLVKHMHKVAEALTKESQHEHFNFNIGYHAEASMGRLHLHVLSDDMNSVCLKTKKHWNSFTTGFFMQAKDVYASLKKHGSVKLLSADECKEFMNTPLKCHKCDYIPKNMKNDMKKHILQHIEQ